jgi:hypothetical protein
MRVYRRYLFLSTNLVTLPSVLTYFTIRLLKLLDGSHVLQAPKRVLQTRAHLPKRTARSVFLLSLLDSGKRVLLMLILIHPGYEGQDDTNIKGGMTIYYTQKDFNSSDLENYTTAFPAVSPPTSPSSYLSHNGNGNMRLIQCVMCTGFPHDRRQSSHRHPKRHEKRPRIHMSRNHSNPRLRNA